MGNVGYLLGCFPIPGLSSCKDPSALSALKVGLLATMRTKSLAARDTATLARWLQHRDILFPSALPTTTAQILALPRLHQSFFALNFEKPNNQ